jgi:hypothetical protein
MRKLIVVLGVVAGLVGVRPAAAQGVAVQAAPETAPDGAEAPPPANSLEPGARALSFSIPTTGSGSFGYTRFRSDERSTTWEARVQTSYRKRDLGRSDESRTDLSLHVGPTFRRYWETERRVVPFFSHRYFVGYNYHRDRTEADDMPDKTRADLHFVSLGAGAAVGLEWFPVRQMSLRGETGVSGSLGSDFSRFRFASDKQSNHGWTAMLSTYTAGLTVSLYLPRRER